MSIRSSPPKVSERTYAVPRRAGSSSKTFPLFLAFTATHTLMFLAVVLLAVKNGRRSRSRSDKIAAGEIPYADPPTSTLSEALYPDHLFDIIIPAALSRIGAKPLVLYGVGRLFFADVALLAGGYTFAWEVGFLSHPQRPGRGGGRPVVRGAGRPVFPARSRLPPGGR